MQTAIAQALLNISAVGFSLDQLIKFKSGILSPVYVDNRRLAYHPIEWRTVIEGFAQLIEETAVTYDVIAGVAVGGVPHSSALAYHIGKPSVFVRKEPKDHGSKKLVEGGYVDGKRVLLIEDLVTMGGSSLSGIEALRAEGAIVTDLFAIVSYGFVEAQTVLNNAQIQLHTLTNFTTILAEARARQLFSEDTFQTLEDWFADPHGWAERHDYQ